MAIFTGSGVALITPFLEDKEIDYEGLDRLIEYHCTHATDSIIICGTTGEASTLSEEERMDVVKFTVERVKRRVPVIAGTGSNCTKITIDLSKAAVKNGVDGLLIVTPYYNKTTQEGLFQQYLCVAKEARAPMILYNVGSRTGLNMEAETVAKIFREVDSVVGIKEASGNLSQCAKIMQYTDGKIDLYSGKDDQIVPMLALGGKGVISVLANVAPDTTHEICAKFFAGDFNGSLALQLKALPLISKLFCEVNPIPVKKAVEWMGLPSGGLRMPLVEISKEHEMDLLKEMKSFGILFGDKKKSEGES